MSLDFVKSEKRQQVFELRLEGLSLHAIAATCGYSLQETNELLKEALRIVNCKCRLSLTERAALDFEETRLSLERDMRHVPIDFLEELRQREQEIFEAIKWDLWGECEHLDLG